MGTAANFIRNVSPQLKFQTLTLLRLLKKENSVAEKKIMKEIFRNGAVVGEFKAPNRFRYYDKGILIDEDKPANM